jgi:glyoxylase-like metal-dependent hydrolase (beta-lactamase superfamily II)
MKSTALIALLLAGGLAASAAAQQPPAGSGAPPAPAARPRPPRATLPPPEPIEHVTKNVWKIFGGGGNTTVVVQKAGVVLVDTKMPGNGPAILDQVKRVTSKPVVLIINTHSHIDHVGSTGYIRDQYPNVQIVMNEKSKEELLANPRNDPKDLPTKTYTDELTLGSGDDRIELYHFGPGHTLGDTFVFFPAQHVLCMGDVMAWDMAPFLPSGGAANIADEIDKLVAVMKGKGVQYVIEGHGNVNTWPHLERFARFNRALIKAARYHYDRGDPPSAAVADLEKVPEFAPLLDHKIKQGLEYGNTPFARANMNVNVAYAEFAGEKVGFGVANGAPLPATDKHKGSNPADTHPPTPAEIAAETPRPKLPGA